MAGLTKKVTKSIVEAQKQKCFEKEEKVVTQRMANRVFPSARSIKIMVFLASTIMAVAIAFIGITTAQGVVEIVISISGVYICLCTAMCAAFFGPMRPISEEEARYFDQRERKVRKSRWRYFLPLAALLAL